MARAGRLLGALILTVVLGGAGTLGVEAARGGGARAEAALRAAGMRQNYDAVHYFKARVEYRQVGGGQTITDTFLMWYIAPGTVRFDTLSRRVISSPPTVGPGNTSSWTDGREVWTINELPKLPGQRSKGPQCAGRMSRATGTRMDWGSHDGNNPLSAMYGSGLFVYAESLQSMAESGKTLRAGPERQFGSPGYGFLFDRGGGRDLYFWIDDAHGCLPRVVRFREGGKVVGEARITEVKKAGNAWLPTKVAVLDASPGSAPQSGAMRVVQFDVTTKLSPASLKLRFRPGTVVRDDIRHKTYTVR